MIKPTSKSHKQSSLNHSSTCKVWNNESKLLGIVHTNKLAARKINYVWSAWVTAVPTLFILYIQINYPVSTPCFTKIHINVILLLRKLFKGVERIRQDNVTMYSVHNKHTMQTYWAGHISSSAHSITRGAGQIFKKMF